MITENLAREVINIRYEKLPENVANKAKMCFLDFLGVSLSGSKNSSSKNLANIFSSKEEATIVGHKMASSADAAFCNGIFAHSLDLDDGHRYAHLHPGCAVIPAALALSEARDKNGRIIYKILKIKSSTSAHLADIKQDYNLIQDLAKNNKRLDIMYKWYTEKRKSTFIHIDDSFKNCNFKAKDWFKSAY